MGDDIKAGRSTSYDYWVAAHVGGAKIKTDRHGWQTRSDVITK